MKKTLTVLIIALVPLSAHAIEEGVYYTFSGIFVSVLKNENLVDIHFFTKSGGGGWSEARGIERSDGSVLITSSGSDYNEVSRLFPNGLGSIETESLICVSNEVTCEDTEQLDPAMKLLPQTGIGGIYESALNSRAVIHQAGENLFVLLLDFSDYESNYDWSVLKTTMATELKSNAAVGLISNVPPEENDDPFDADVFLRFEGDQKEDMYIEFENCEIIDPERLSSCDELEAAARFIRIF